MIRRALDARSHLEVDGVAYEVFRLDSLQPTFDVARLPRTLKVLLENLLRHEDGVSVRREDVEALAGWKATDEPSREVAFTPARVLLQDFTGVPAIVDLAAMRDALIDLGGDEARIEPLVPAELVIDHSVQVDVAGTRDAFARNVDLEFERNGERYALLRWGQGAFGGLRVVPPGTGIVHQVNLEHLARVVFVRDLEGGRRQVYPDTLVGTDSHTTMVNGLGVLGWGVGGIEAEAALLGQPTPLLIPRVVGVELTGALAPGVTATDLVLTVTERLRAHGVVGKFVEFHGDGLKHLSLADRATIANMSPEFGSTCAFFPIDDETLRYLRLSGRDPKLVRLVEAYARAQGLFREAGERAPEYSEQLTIDLAFVVPCLAGPRRPQDRVPLDQASAKLREALAARAPAVKAGPPAGSHDAASADSFPASDPPSDTAPHPGDGEPDRGCGQQERLAARPKAATSVRLASGETVELDHGHVVIAAITSCTNTSNPEVMLAAALLARNAARRGLRAKPWVKTSLAPGSRVVMSYYERAGLLPDLEALGFHLVGFGCTTCIGNSGPLAPEIAEAVAKNDLAVAAVLSGNRNFEGRIHPSVRLNYLGSPPLVVAYALAGTLLHDLTRDPLGHDAQGQPVFLRDLWPTPDEVRRVRDEVVKPELFSREYAHVFEGDERWRALPVPSGQRFAWDERSTYVRRPPFFEGLSRTPPALHDISGARVLVKLGDSVTTDHISPAGSIAKDSPAGQYLQARGVPPSEFNSYGARRGNHEVMLRGTFANVRLRNQLAPGTEGGFTRHLPDGEVMPIYDAAVRYQQEQVPLLVIAGADYGSGSSRDWAAKGTRLLGVRAVLAVSYERIHRSNLIGMGVLPLQFLDGESAESLGLTGEEVYDVLGLERLARGELPRELVVRVDGRELGARVRIDSPKEAEYFRHGGILQYVLRQLAEAA